MGFCGWCRPRRRSAASTVSGGTTSRKKRHGVETAGSAFNDEQLWEGASKREPHSGAPMLMSGSAVRESLSAWRSLLHPQSVKGRDCIEEQGDGREHPWCEATIARWRCGSSNPLIYTMPNKSFLVSLLQALSRSCRRHCTPRLESCQYPIVPECAKVSALVCPLGTHSLAKEETGMVRIVFVGRA